jgi:hypothetical protein
MQTPGNYYTAIQEISFSNWLGANPGGAQESRLLSNRALFSVARPD